MKRLARTLGWSFSALCVTLGFFCLWCVLATHAAIGGGALNGTIWKCIAPKQVGQVRTGELLLVRQVQWFRAGEHAVPNLSWQIIGLTSEIGLSVGYTANQRAAMVAPLLLRTPTCPPHKP